MSAVPVKATRWGDGLRTAMVMFALLSTIVGFFWLASDKIKPGPQAMVPRVWPARSGLARDPSRPTLVMFAHPRCPCTNASLSELRKVMSNHPHDVTFIVAFAMPTGVGPEWRTSFSHSTAESLEGLIVVDDADEREARRFGAMTSGQVVLFGASGELLFQGGITSSRGHEGDNAGEDQVLALLSNRAAGETSPVFGCELDQEAP